MQTSINEKANSSARQIWVDADASPKVIKEILYKACERTKTNMVLVANQLLETPRSRYIRSIQVASGFDVADNYIVENSNKGDIVITADIPLAAELVAKDCVVLNPSLKVAVSEGLIPTNPCDKAKTVKPEKADIQCLDDAQTVTMLKAAAENRSSTIHPLIVLAVTSAMRRGELAGLKWKDVDLDEGFLWVKKALEDTKKHGLVLKKPKTETSKRKIHLPALAVSALIAHKADQNALRLRSGFGKGGERFVFETFRDDQFGPVHPRALTKMFGSFIAGVECFPLAHMCHRSFFHVWRRIDPFTTAAPPRLEGS